MQKSKGTSLSMYIYIYIHVSAHVAHIIQDMLQSCEGRLRDSRTGTFFLFRQVADEHLNMEMIQCQTSDNEGFSCSAQTLQISAFPL